MEAWAAVGSGFVLGVAAIAVAAVGYASAAGPHAFAPSGHTVAGTTHQSVPAAAHTASTSGASPRTGAFLQALRSLKSSAKSLEKSAPSLTQAVIAPALPGTAPPASLADNCSEDVSAGMRWWLSSLAPGTVVHAPAGACYLVNEGLRLVGLRDISIIGGQWEDHTKPVSGASPNDMGAVFWFVGGSGITVENVTISGVNPGGYDPSGAFAGALRSDGVVGFTASNITVQNVYGDGVTLDPLRGSTDDSSTIVRPSENVVLHNVSVDGAGRQGIALTSVSGASMSDIEFSHIGLDVFDVEADQGNEGAQNVTVDGCTVHGDTGGIFFANGGAGSGSPWTSNVQIDDCTMDQELGGDVVLVDNISPTGTQRGPFTFIGDQFRCGASVYVACTEVSNGNVTFSGCTFIMPGGEIHEHVYQATNGSTVNFFEDSVHGDAQPGSASGGSSAAVFGGNVASTQGGGSSQNGGPSGSTGAGSPPGLGSTLSQLGQSSSLNAGSTPGPGATPSGGLRPGAGSIPGVASTPPQSGTTPTTTPSRTTTTTTPKPTTTTTTAPCLLCSLLGGG